MISHKTLTLALIVATGFISASSAAPVMTDPDLSAELIYTGPFLTGLGFIGPNDVLINEKASGKIFRVTSSGNSLVLDLNVDGAGERGLLDMAVHPDFANNHYVYVYYTYTTGHDGNNAVSNRVSRFTWNGTALTDEFLVIDLPSTPGPIHNGGILKFGPPNVPVANQKLFVIIGDLNRDGQTQNYIGGEPPDFSGQILRLNPDGTTPTGADRGPFYDVAGDNQNLRVLYAYGVRNSYGMDFDPVTGKLWDTENGPNLHDEVNLVEPGFNSGWETIVGYKTGAEVFTQFGGVGTYSDPEFCWYYTVAPTAIHFFRGTGLGLGYQNACFVGDSNYGKLYMFPMNTSRTGFALADSLADGMKDPSDSDEAIIAGSGFGSIINMTTGPDGNLYVLAWNSLYKIKSQKAAAADWELYQ